MGFPVVIANHHHTPIDEPVALHGVGPRVEEPGLMFMFPYPCSAPL